MELSRELMEQGSYQVEMSDEGLMAQDIEDRLTLVMKALERVRSSHGRKDHVVRGDAQARPCGLHLRSGTPGTEK